MIQKPLDRVEKADIDSLVADEVREGRGLEYKQALPTNSDDDKREFLADVSSFANAAGGDILYGVEEQRDQNGKTTGIPESATGLAGLNADQEIRRLDNLLRDGIQPRIAGAHIRPVEGFVNGPVLLVRLQKSYAAPHMVTFKNLSRFFSRNSGGKYQLDVGEIRSAFALSETLPERIRRFRDERLARIVADETPVRLRPGPRLVLHLLPVAALDPTTNVDLSVFDRQRSIWPMGSSGSLDWRFNFDGVVFYCPPHAEEEGANYVQVFRSGALEAVYAERLTDKRLIQSPYLENEAIDKLAVYLSLQRDLNLSPPIFALLTVLGVKGYYVPFGAFTDIKPPIDRDILLLPDALVEDFADKPEKLLRPAIDALWQSAGWSRCRYYDSQGNWKPDPGRFW